MGKARYLEEREIEAIRRALDGKSWMVFQVSVETGLRIGDVVALRWDDVEGERITYRAQKTGKLGAAELTAPTAAWIGRQRRWATSPWVFASPSKPGAHITRQAVWMRLKAAARRAGVDASGVSPHSFRKVFAVQTYHQRGIRAAQEALQHDRPEVTEVYALADWLTGEEAAKPLLRQDMVRIAVAVSHILGLDKSPRA